MHIAVTLSALVPQNVYYRLMLGCTSLVVFDSFNTFYAFLGLLCSVTCIFAGDTVVDS